MTRITAILTSLMLASACSKDAGSKGPLSHSPPDAGDDAAAEGGDASADLESVPTTCEELEFRANGQECASCSLECDCPDGFPISIAHCSDDGCLFAADCDAVCRGGLEFAFDCTDTYQAPLRDGEPCTSATDCQGQSCRAGVCDTWEAAWAKGYHSPVFSIRNDVAVTDIQADSVGARVLVWSKDGIGDDHWGSRAAVAGFGPDGEERFWVRVIGDEAVALGVASDDSIVLGRISGAMTVLGEEIMADDEDYYVGRFGEESVLMPEWFHHFPNSERTADGAVVGDAFVSVYQRGESEVVFVAHALTDGALLWEEAVPFDGDFLLQVARLDDQHLLTVLRTSVGGTILDVSAEANTSIAAVTTVSDGSTVAQALAEESMKIVGESADDILMRDPAWDSHLVAWSPGSSVELTPWTPGAVVDAGSGGGATALYLEREGRPGVLRLDDEGERWAAAAVDQDPHLAVGPDGTVYLAGAGQWGIAWDESLTDTAAEPERRRSLFFIALEP